MHKLGVIVCGRVASGNRITARILQRFGCRTYILHGTPRTEEHPGPSTRRSAEAALAEFPLAERWVAIRPVRSEYARSRSVLRTRMHDWITWPTVYLDMRVFKFCVEQNLPLFHVSYEAMVKHPLKEFKALHDQIEFPYWDPAAFSEIEVFDGNRKYLH